MGDPRLIGLDWGTTSCRAYLIGADGAVLARVADGPGILKVENGAFDIALDRMIGRWMLVHGRLPVILSGMIGSRQGWIEVPYAPCPAGETEIVESLAIIDRGQTPITAVPGLSTESDGMPDVMRGEETQVLGALALLERQDGVFVLPGTHSKWAHVEGGRIVSFRTFMTGELFAALKQHTILGRLMPAVDGPKVLEAFARGVDEAAGLGSPGALLNRLFATRTYGLMDRLPSEGLPDYLSGLLIGAEVAEATRRTTRDVFIVAAPPLAGSYSGALFRLKRHGWHVRGDCAAAGHWRIARAAGLV